MTKHVFLRKILCGLLVISCVGCSSSKPPEPPKPQPPEDINFDQSNIEYSMPFHGQDSLINKLKEQDIQVIHYGDTMTVIVPNDKYFNQGSTELNDANNAGLNNLVKLLQFYPKNIKYVAAFDDNSGTSKDQKDMTQGRAEKMVTFLWANGVPAELLNAQGYGDKFPLGSNKSVHSRTYNRRIEIQWAAFKDQCCPTPQPYPMPKKNLKKGMK